MTLFSSVTCAVILAVGCRPTPRVNSPPPAVPPAPAAAIDSIDAGGTAIRFLQQGRGVAVLFIHGAISDHRYWDAQREAIARQYRFIALDRRYFGPAPWPDTTVRMSDVTDAADAARLIRHLDLGPAFVVGVSGGANVALRLAVEHPGVVRGLFIHEPTLASIVTDTTVWMAARAPAAQGGGPAAAARAGRIAEAAKLFVERVNAGRIQFEQLPPAVQAMFVENARTLTLETATDTPLTCDHLRRLQIPVTISRGEWANPRPTAIASAAQRCIPYSELLVVKEAGHSAPRENPAAFNEPLLDFLARHQGRARLPTSPITN